MARRVSSRLKDATTIDLEIARLRGLEIGALRARWQSATGRAAPPHLAKHLLFAMLAYRLQADALGDLDANSIQLVKRAASADSAEELASLINKLDQRNQELCIGAILSREWNGHVHKLTVLADGYAWQSRTYDSLSKVAFAITGTKWNGPRFFGLRARSDEQAEP